MNSDIRITDTSLVMLRAVDSMTPDVRRSLTRWLWAHEIIPAHVTVGLPIERDDARGTLRWHETRPDGTVVRRWRLSSSPAQRRWPASFPAALLTVQRATALDRTSSV